jgi:TonB family protein
VVIVDITVNAAGDVSTAGVVSGPQELRASAFTAALGLKYAPGKSITAMQIAFEYMLTGTTWGVKIGEALPNIGLRPAGPGPVIMSSRGPENEMPPAFRVGGAVMPPKKTKDAAPVYPPIAQEARVQGVVIMEARVDETGNVSDVRVLRSIPLLDQAAIDAVRQWQYTPTTMNGIAVPVLMTVTVNFSLRKLFQYEVVQPDGRASVVGLGANALLAVPGARFQLRASELQDSKDVTVSLFSEDGQTHLGDVTLPLDGPVVQTPTTPSVGLRFLGIR